jgi:thiol-disulfide isomerase/thioredoxin
MSERRKIYLQLLTCTLAFLQVIVQAQAQSVSIKAFLPYWHNAVVQLTIDGKRVHIDSFHNDVYSYTGKIEGTKQGTFEIKRKNITTFLSLFIEPGVIKIRDEGQRLVAYGTPLNDAFFQLNHSIDSLALLQKNLRFNELKHYKRKLAETYIQHHPASPISLKLLNDYFYLDNEANDTVYYSLFHSLDASLKNSYPAKKIREEAAQRYATATGRVAPFLQLLNLENKLSSLYETGSYTLIIFWGSWCVPCKKEFPALEEIYKHDSNQITIVSVSLDEDKIAWKSAVQKAKLPWKQLSDLKGWYKGVAYTFGIKAIPNNFLLDKNGIIIGKNLSIEQLNSLISQIFPAD